MSNLCSPLGRYVCEVRERLGLARKTIYSVTNNRGFIPALETFGKQVFSEDTSNYKVVGQNDLAFNPSRINVGSVALCPDENGGAVSPMYTIVRCREGLLPEYLLYFLRSPIGLAEINHRTEGAVRFQLKFADLQRIPVYLPNVSEQQRIVRILDEADGLRRLRARADRRTAALVPAIFHEMFGDPISNSRQWKLKAISEVAEVQGGLQLSPIRETYSLRLPYLRVANVQRGYLVLNEIKEIGLTEEELQRVTLRKNDLLLVEGNGNPNEIGRAAVWDGSINNCVHQNHLIRVRCESQFLDSDYLLTFVNSEAGKFYFRGAGNSTSGLVTISTSVVKRCMIPVPPLPLQQQFAARVAEVRALEESQAASRRKLDALFDSLLHRAFRGEL